MRAPVHHGVGRTLWDVVKTFPLPQMLDAYDVFARAADAGALKVVCKKP